MSEMSNTEEREDTACIEITCSVKGYQECNFTVDVGEEFFIFISIDIIAVTLATALLVACVTAASPRKKIGGEKSLRRFFSGERRL